MNISKTKGYARLAMREFEWYQNLADEACAMPGTFAVFALGLEGPQWCSLVCDYLDLCEMCIRDRYHIVFAPKYRRKLFYGENRKEIGGISVSYTHLYSPL